jgi:hypothetical protein
MHLNEAMRILVGPEPQRHRLHQAFAISLSRLTQKDLPTEAHAAFERINFIVYGGIAAADMAVLASAINRMNDVELAGAITDVIVLYDAVTRYQPITANSR